MASLPSFRSRSGGENLRAAIIHYEANSREQVTMGMMCIEACPKGFLVVGLYRRPKPRIQGKYLSGKYLEF